MQLQVMTCSYSLTEISNKVIIEYRPSNSYRQMQCLSPNPGDKIQGLSIPGLWWRALQHRSLIRLCPQKDVFKTRKCFVFPFSYQPIGRMFLFHSVLWCQELYVRLEFDIDTCSACLQSVEDVFALILATAEAFWLLLHPLS